MNMKKLPLFILVSLSGLLSASAVWASDNCFGSQTKFQITNNTGYEVTVKNIQGAVNPTSSSFTIPNKATQHIGLTTAACNTTSAAGCIINVYNIVPTTPNTQACSLEVSPAFHNTLNGAWYVLKSNRCSPAGQPVFTLPAIQNGLVCGGYTQVIYEANGNTYPTLVLCPPGQTSC